MKLILKIFIVILLTTPLFSSAYFSKNLYYGMRSDAEVEALQEFLADQGLFTGTPTGNFYSLTLKAVKAFQQREGISPISGFFGVLSRNKSNAILASQGISDSSVTTEEGTTAPVVINPLKTTNDIVASLMEQIALLQQQLTALQNQQAKLDTQQQTLGVIQQEQVKQTAALEQVKVNTTPAPAPVPVPPPAPPPAPPVQRYLEAVSCCYNYNPEWRSVHGGEVMYRVDVYYFENKQRATLKEKVFVIADDGGKIVGSGDMDYLDNYGLPRAYFEYFPIQRGQRILTATTTSGLSVTFPSGGVF